jgi:hypothetical protein
MHYAISCVNIEYYFHKIPNFSLKVFSNEMNKNVYVYFQRPVSRNYPKMLI